MLFLKLMVDYVSYTGTNHVWLHLVENNCVLQCLFDYGASSWYTNLSKSLKRKLQVNQNKMARFVLGANKMFHIGREELLSLGYLNVETRVKYLRLCHVFKIFQNQHATYMHSRFTRVCIFHNYVTRNSMYNFIVPNTSGIESKSFFNLGIRDWNALPNELKIIKSTIRFKMRLKEVLTSEIPI